MKRIIAIILSAMLLSSAVCIPTSALNTKQKNKPKKAEYVEGEAIVVLKDSAGADYTKSKKAASVYGVGIKLKNSYSFAKKSGKLRCAVLKSSKLSTDEIISGVKKNPDIKYAFPNYKKKTTAITNDPYSKFQWGLYNIGQNSGKKDIDIKADSLWDKASKSTDENVVAVIDTGVDFTHEELKDHIWKNPYGNKLLGSCGIDITGTYSDLKPRDDYGHGTHVAGIIAAQGDNQKGISGVNKSNVTIMPIKAFDVDGEGSDDNIIAAFDYIQRAIDLGTKVSTINCSFGGLSSPSDLKLYDDIINALGEKGVVTCVAAGNESWNLNEMDDPDSDYYTGGLVYTPTCSSSPYCVTVTSINENGNVPSYANSGDKYVDVAAPGTNILSLHSENSFNPAIYSADDINKLCADYQDYNGSIKSGDFGYPDIVPEIRGYNKVCKNVSIAKSDSAFGLSGKCLTVTPNQKGKYSVPAYAFEIPFTLEDEDKDYYISFSVKSDTLASGYVLDAPADMDTYEDFDEYAFYGEFGAYGENDWTHYNTKVDTSSSNYEKSKSRKLVFYVESESALFLDDVAISSQSANEDDFGKYEFLSGTSMAVPFVAGAAALIKNAYPDASAIEIANMAANTGVKLDSLESKVKNQTMVTLDNVEKTPPMINKAGYGDDGRIKVEGSFKDITKAYINGEEVNILSKNEKEVILPDNNYSTYTVKIKLENSYGYDEIEQYLSKKKPLPDTKLVNGFPEDTSTSVFVPAGYNAYLMDLEYGTVGKLTTVTPKKSYTYEDEVYNLDLKKLFDNYQYSVGSAAYCDNKIYFTARNGILGANKTAILGYDNILACFDLNTEKTTKLCDIPDECLIGSTLAILNKNIYLIGGYDYNELKCLDCVYKYNASKKKLVKSDANLPEARAYASYIEYKGKLVGVYGAVESGKMPAITVFDGKSWKTSSVKLESDDCVSRKYSDEKTLMVYKGNIGVDKNGVFCNGAFVEGCGDTYIYDVANDKILQNDYCYRNDDSKPMLIGTCVAGAFVGFSGDDPEAEYDDEDDEDYQYDSSSFKFTDMSAPDQTSESKTFLVELDNTSMFPVPPKEPKLSEEYLTLKAGSEKTLKVKNGTVKSWKSSDKSVASVKNGKVSALKAGVSEIIATLTSGKKLTCYVMVTTSPSIKINGKSFKSSATYSVKKGSALTVKISGKAPSVNNVYKSSNKKVAKVVSAKSAKTVKIKGLKKGKATVTIKVNGVSFKIKVKVK